MDAKYALAKELCKAIQRDDLSLTELLLSQGASPNTPLPEGVSPFHIAVGIDNSIEYVKLMLQYNGNPNVRSSEGVTPLHVAAMWGKYDSLQLLIYNGGDPYIREEENKDTCDLAEEYGDKQCIDLLKDYQLWNTDVQEDVTPKYSFLPVPNNSQDAIDLLHHSRNQTLEITVPPNTLSSSQSSPMSSLSGYSPSNQRPSSPCSWQTLSTVQDSTCSHYSDFSDSDEEIAFNFTKSVSFHGCTDQGTPSSGFSENELDLGRSDSQQSVANMSTATYIISRGTPEPHIPCLSCGSSNRSSIDDTNESASKPDTQSALDNNSKPSSSVSLLNPLPHDNTCSSESSLNTTVDTLSEILSSEMTHGLDVTSPDHPQIFTKMSTSSSEDEYENKFEKTLLFFETISEEDGEAFQEEEKNGTYLNLKKNDVKLKEDVENNDVSRISETPSESESPKEACLESSKNSEDSNNSASDFFSAEEHLSHSNRTDNALDISDTPKSANIRACPDTLILNDSVEHPCSVVCKQEPQINKDSTENSCPDTQVLENQDEQIQSGHNEQLGRAFRKFRPSQITSSDTVSLASENVSCTMLNSGQTTPDTIIFRNDDTIAICDTRVIDDTAQGNVRELTNKLGGWRLKRTVFNMSDLLTSDDTADYEPLTDRYAELSVEKKTMTSSPGQSADGPVRNQTVEFIYTDSDAGATLIEKRCPSSCSSSENSLLSGSVNSSLDLSSDNTIIYDWQKYQTDTSLDAESEPEARVEIPVSLNKLTNEQLRKELLNHGELPGPITSFTRDVYLELLNKLKKDASQLKINRDNSKISTAGYFHELSRCILQNHSVPDMQDDEQKMSNQFDQPDPLRKWREGTLKSSFNYLILDPRVTKNLPVRHHNGLNETEAFKVFISAIFYIGKGKRARPYAHFYEALEQLTNPRLRPTKKVQHITDIWQLGLGVVSLHCFQSVIPVEAYTREACMVDCIGLSRLTNAKKGDYYGIAATWSASKKRQMGVFLLHKAFKIFLVEGERQIRPADIRKGQ
ncbi:uncharacterized protein LOC100377070 [Saccoglossus kowalevskii]|uniref:Dentin sialophosphoprotein-like n=1 Tax=Saccoglossus kowalevskii TaxID=10224 RepID=A0ABM0GM29_SACKO|nr:PREDICTED: dentin sialophosphoprotein-like [Saccoglossus kowalevskii]